MFERLISWWKGVTGRMFGYSQLKAIAGQDVTMSQAMIDAINRWKDMINGRADWIDEKRGVLSLRTEIGICREFTDIALGEMDAKVSSPVLDSALQFGIRNLNEQLQDGLALGSFILKPLGGQRSEFVTADKFIPVSFDDAGKPNDVLFLTRKRIGETSWYTRVERHRFDANGFLTIETSCYHSSDESDIGLPCSLTSVPEWSGIDPGPVTYPGMQQNDYGYFRVPLRNRVDGSPCGVSIFAEAEDLIRQADIQYGRLDWEYSSGERAVHVDERALRHTASGKVSIPSGKQRLYRGLNLDQNGNGGELYKEYSPAMRDDAFIRGLEKAYRSIEFVVGLSYGDLSDTSDVDKTATEIKASKQRKYNRVNAIQENLRNCLSDFVDALAFYNDQYTSGYQFSCLFNDSILTDEETERDQDRKDVAMGAMSLKEYRMKWYQEDEATAEANLPEQSSGVLE